MADHKKDGQLTQRTPKGYEIPIPKKADVMRDLTKIAKPKKHQP